MFRRLSIVLFAAAVFVPLSSAQMRGAMGRPVSVGHAGFARGVRGGIGLHHTSPFTRGIILGSPFFSSDYDGSAPYVVESDVGSAPPQFVVVRPVSADDSPRRTRLKPLLIEWQGDRYVRFGGTEETKERGTSTHPDYAEPTDRKSTRLNSSHLVISYAVFCLKKKKKCAKSEYSSSDVNSCRPCRHI